MWCRLVFEPYLTITNHLGEVKSTVRSRRGILVKDLLKNAELQEKNPKKWSAYYFVFSATDGYTVVYSWNEIFNSATGDNLFIVTEKAGNKMDALVDRMLVVSSTDHQTGRRYVKGLKEIKVMRAG